MPDGGADWLTLYGEVHKERKACVVSNSHFDSFRKATSTHSCPAASFRGIFGHKPNSVAVGAQSSLRASQNLNIKGWMGQCFLLLLARGIHFGSLGFLQKGTV